MDKATYLIQGQEYTQTFLTIAQTIQVAKLFENFQLKKVDVFSVLEHLEKSGVLEKFFNIVLQGPKLKLNEIQPAIAIQVIRDFFCLNNVLDVFSMIVELIAEVSQDPQLTCLMTSLKEMSPTGMISSP